ncbi:mate-domain-containing protein [Spinellus fusiger]|nr:mate-domain-containing protein [Spinellus fusiger]
MSPKAHTEADEAVSTRSSVSSTSTETSPLLSHKLDTETTWSTEVWWLFNNSLPVVFTYLLQNSLQMASIFTLGHLGPTQLAASALASMFASVSAWSMAFGTATALDTLCSQAWTGAKDKTLLGVHLQRALVILGLMFLPISVVWWNATRILIALGQEEQLAIHAGTFLRVLIIGAPAFITFEAIKKFLQAQGIMRASTYVLFIASPLNLLMNYTFVYVEPFKLGFIGAPLATSITYWIMLLLLLAYIKYRGCEAWGGWTRECLTDWWPFLRLAIPGVLMVCTEWWAFELSALAASYLGTLSLAAQSIVLTSGSAAYTIPFGIAVAASNRVGNSLGEGKPMKAKYAAKAALIFALTFAVFSTTVFMSTRHSFGYMFTDDAEVVRLVATILPMCALFQVADGLSGICGGVIRGLGRQKVAAWINLFAYYVIALPTGYFLTFKANAGLVGIWSALSLALLIASVCELIFLKFIDWDAEVKKTLKRVHNEEDQLHERE